MPGFLKRVFGKLSRKPKLKEVPVRPAEKPMGIESLIETNWKSHNFGKQPAPRELNEVKEALFAFARGDLRPNKRGAIIPQGFSSEQIQVFNALRYHVQSPWLRLIKMEEGKKKR